MGATEGDRAIAEPGEPMCSPQRAGLPDPVREPRQIPVGRKITASPESARLAVSLGQRSSPERDRGRDMPATARSNSGSRIPAAVALLSMLLPLSVGTAGAAETFIRVETHSNEFTNANHTYLLTPATGQITALTTIGQPETVSIQYRPANFQDSWFFRLSPPAGQPLAPGRYDDAGSPLRAGQPELNISG